MGSRAARAFVDALSKDPMMIIALAVAFSGLVLMLLSTGLMRALVINLDEYNRRTAYRRNMNYFEILIDLRADKQFIAPMLGGAGMLLLFGGVILLLARVCYLLAR